MDFFCYRASQYTGGLGEKTEEASDWKVSWDSSGNLEQLALETGIALAAGTLLGSLRTSDGLASGESDVLGRDALDSNGSFAVVIAHPDALQIVTDAGGSIPVYWGRGPQGLAVGTQVHRVARATGLTSVDEVSVADYLINGTVCHPFSWYEGVRALPPGAVCTFDREGLDVHVYYEPQEPDDIYDDADAREWGTRLRREVKTAIEQGIDGQEKVRVLFSGGEDSRAVTGLIPDRVECVPTTVLDRRNREYELAQRAARWLGYSLDWVRRPDEFYRSSIRERIDTVGPGWDFRHTHFFGEVADALRDADALIGGFLSDTLFKTYWMTNVDTYPRSRRPPRLRDPTPDGMIVPVRESAMGCLHDDLVGAVNARRRAHHETLLECRPRTAGNWHPLWPLVHQPHYAGYLTSLRIGPRVVEPFLFHRVYRLAAKMPDPCRVDRRAFRQAFCGPMGAAGWLPDSSDRLPCLGGWAGSLFRHYRRRFRESDAYSLLFGGEEGYQKAWSPDHVGWHPVDPAEHFDEPGEERLRERLSQVLGGRSPRAFLRDEELADAVKVRALALGWDGTERSVDEEAPTMQN